MILLYLYYSYTEAPLMRGIVSVCSPAVLGTACFRQSGDGVLKRQSAVRALSQEDPELFGAPMTKAREKFRQNTSGEVKIRSDRVFFKALGKTTTTTQPLRCFLSPSPLCCREHLVYRYLNTHIIDAFASTHVPTPLKCYRTDSLGRGGLLLSNDSLFLAAMWSI